MLRHLYYPFLPYRSIVVPFLVACAVIVPCWVAYRLYRRRIPAHRPSWRRELLLLAFVIYLSGLVAATLEPNRPSRAVLESMVGIDLRPSLASLTCISATLPQGSAARGFCVRNARGNLALFVPFGILLPLVWRGLRFRRGLLIALAVSISIELLQYLSTAWGSYRTADINDVILNCVGASIGLALVSVLRSWRETQPWQVTRPAPPT